MPATIYLILKVTLNLKKSLNCKINKYNSNPSEHDEAEKACILGYRRMPKINSTVDQFATANISALSMLEVLKKVVKVQSHVTNTLPIHPHQNQDRIMVLNQLLGSLIMKTLNYLFRLFLGLMLLNDMFQELLTWS